jgi:hypothetical protein
MAATTELGKCAGAGAIDGPQSPYYALNYHFGMLLGVEDFATEQSYHRGKMRLHNAWLHRMGVVWGLDVRIDLTAGEVRVTPGLAIDGAGRELHLDAAACVNVGQWFEAHEAEVTATGTATRNTFDAFVAARFKNCFTRQVPALLDPCEGAGGGTAYSRLFETIDLQLLPAPPPDPPPLANHRLRVLFGLEAAKLPDDQAVADERDRILTLAPADHPAAYVVALRRFAALDTIDAKPFESTDGEAHIAPVAEDTPVVLALIKGITVERRDNQWTLTAGTPDITVRPVLLATATIQELLCGLRGASAAAASTGPCVKPDTVVINTQFIEFETDKDLAPESVTTQAFSVTVLDSANGWKDVPADPPSVSGTPLRKVKVPLQQALANDARVRFIARGSGPAPILGADFVPLAGVVGGPHPSANDGLDFVLMLKRS